MSEDATHEERVLLRGAVRMHEADGYVRMWHSRPARTGAELAELTEGFEHALRDARTGRLLVDSRDSEYLAGEMQQRLWEWLDRSPRVSHVAFVVRSANYAEFVNRAGIGPGVLARAFHDEADAVRWLAP